MRFYLSNPYQHIFPKTSNDLNLTVNKQANSVIMMVEFYHPLINITLEVEHD